MRGGVTVRSREGSRAQIKTASGVPKLLDRDEALDLAAWLTEWAKEQPESDAEKLDKLVREVRQVCSELAMERVSGPTTMFNRATEAEGALREAIRRTKRP